MVKSKQLVLPRVDKQGKSYISYSQINVWKKSKREYIRQYFLGESGPAALKPYGDFGTKIGEALENNDFSEFTEKEQEFLKTVTRYDEFEREISLKMDGFYVKGYIDSNTLSYETKNKKKVQVVNKILDYKTGEISKRRADYESDDYIQIPIYAAAIKQDTGCLPKECSVVLIQRDGNAFAGEELTLGDEYVTIKKKVTTKVVDDVLKYVQETAEEISMLYELFLKLNK